MNKTYTIYVLRLKDDKFYVGKTTDLNTQLNKHYAHEACAWTTKHHIIDLFASYNGDGFDEDKYVIKYMSEYGVENVRGGSYSNLELTLEQCIAIRRAICSASNACLACSCIDHVINNCTQSICYRCGRVGHLVNTCSATSHAYSGRLDGCYRCGRPDHWAIRCNRSKDIFGRPLEQKCVIS